MIIKNKLLHVIVDEQHKPTPALLNILKETNIKHDGTLRTIFAETQKAWLRPTGQERWENQTLLAFSSDNLPQLLENISLVHAIKPSTQHYNYAVLLGSTVNDIRNRLAYLIELWKCETRFDSVVIFAGKRPLDKTIETPEQLLNNNPPTVPFKKNWHFNGQLPCTETEMIKLIFNQTDMPTEWNTIPIIFVDTPMQKTIGDTLRRPNTQDTINEWLKVYAPKVGSILAISNQPFIGYQDSVLRNSLPKNFLVETVGDINFDNETIPTILDVLARWIYNEYQIGLSNAV
jgi:hypothetical protein